MTRFGTLLIIAALVASIISCAPTPVVQYNLTISSTGGGNVIKPGEGTFSYGEGEVVELVAMADEGYQFVSWTGDVGTIASVGAASTTITMNGDYSITATFQPIRYTLTISSTVGGSVTAPGVGTFAYDAGAVVNVVAAPASGYQFAKWTGDVGAIANATAASTRITMNGYYSITANFAKEIRTWYDLDAIRDNLSATYILMNDLDSTCAGYQQLASSTADARKGWEPIGRLLCPFAGVLDGQGYAIGDLVINRPGEDCVGLFGAVGNGGFIKNLGVINLVVVGRHSVGGLIGCNTDGAVSNCHCAGSVTGHSVVGGLVGLSSRGGTITGSWSAGSVTGVIQVGGIVGCNNGAVAGSRSSCDVVGRSDVGGLAGVAWVEAQVISSYSIGSVTGESYLGGLIGANRGFVNSCYSTSNVTGQASIGGLVGRNGGGVIRSYSAGRLNGDRDIGGLVGHYNPDDPDYRRRAVGACFWDRVTAGAEGSDGGTGKSSSEMKSVTTFEDAGWSIIAVVNPETRNPSYIWNIVDGQTYPFLSWQPVS